MSEENKNPENQQAPAQDFALPKFDLPKTSAPTIRAEPESVAPKFNPRVPAATAKPAGYGAPAAAEEKPMNPALLVLDVLAVAVSVAFAVLIFLDK